MFFTSNIRTKAYCIKLIGTYSKWGEKEVLRMTVSGPVELTKGRGCFQFREVSEETEQAHEIETYRGLITWSGK